MRVGENPIEGILYVLAPKARNSTRAWGSAKAILMRAWAAPRNPNTQDNASAEGAISIWRGFSIPNVPLIEINAVPAKQLAVFLLKGASTMVLLLIASTACNCTIELTRTHRKGAISPLPEKTAIASVKRFDPFRGCLLYLFDELSLGNSSRQRRDNVNVIGNTPDAHEFSSRGRGRLSPSKHASVAGRLIRAKARDSWY